MFMNWCRIAKFVQIWTKKLLIFNYWELPTRLGICHLMSLDTHQACCEDKMCITLE